MKLTRYTLTSAGGAAGLLAALIGPAGCSNDREAQAMSTSRPSQPAPAGREKATFAAGCFWGVEAAFRRVEGVAATTVGYTGGHFDNPTYEDVCSDRTGHAEAVEVIYDPARVSYEGLLEVFWGCHDPTQRNRQGPDVGSQYRSGIFYHDQRQKAAAESSKDKLDRSGRLGRPIATEIVPAATFWPAEDYHQQYLQKRGRASCASTVK